MTEDPMGVMFLFLVGLASLLTVEALCRRLNPVVQKTIRRIRGNQDAR